MTRRTIAVLIVFLLVIAGIVWNTSRKKESAATPVLSVNAFNQTRNTSASNSPASPGDTIVYTLTAENQSDKIIEGYIVEANTSQITDKATLLDASGASYNGATNSLVWTPLDIPAHESITKNFSVKVNSLPTGTTNFTLKITFNNELMVAVTAPVVAGTNTGSINNPPPSVAPYKAPTTGSSEWLPIILAVILTLGFAFRKRLPARNA